ncbi:MAG TPA: hypothetical protein VLF67_04980 [Candidatus Saccharimonas sp.]|nr:hypothetical protein [Candidatus Saccharimonas sp.]
MADTTTALNREITGPFELEGLLWGSFGRLALVTELETARTVAQRLRELGFYPAYATDNERGPGFDFGFIHPIGYRSAPHQWDSIEIHLVPLRFHDRPRYEVALRQDDQWRRFGDRTFAGREQVAGWLLARVHERHGKDNVIVRPTLEP